MRYLALLVSYLLVFFLSTLTASDKQLENPLVHIRTSLGDMFMILYLDDAPLSSNNFLRYVEQGFYDNTIIHRVIDNYLVQGGGYTKEYQPKKTHPPIKNESRFTPSNTFGTVGFALPSFKINFATSQFFINLNDNTQLDYNRKTQRGHAVFGKIIEGVDVLNKIKSVSTHTKIIDHFGKPHKLKDTPKKPIYIHWIRLVQNERYTDF
ncbi:MAG: peptidylprolyl isomerase [bacterium]